MLLLHTSVLSSPYTLEDTAAWSRSASVLHRLPSVEPEGEALCKRAASSSDASKSKLTSSDHKNLMPWSHANTAAAHKRVPLQGVLIPISASTRLAIFQPGSLLLSLLNCFAGGVFLSFGIMHFIPDALEANDNVLGNRYPLVSKGEGLHLVHESSLLQEGPCVLQCRTAHCRSRFVLQSVRVWRLFCMLAASADGRQHLQPSKMRVRDPATSCQSALV